MTCPSCGTENRAGRKFCRGSPVPRLQEQPWSQPGRIPDRPYRQPYPVHGVIQPERQPAAQVDPDVVDPEGDTQQLARLERPA